MLGIIVRTLNQRLNRAFQRENPFFLLLILVLNLFIFSLLLRPPCLFGPVEVETAVEKQMASVVAAEDRPPSVVDEKGGDRRIIFVPFPHHEDRILVIDQSRSMGIVVEVVVLEKAPDGDSGFRVSAR